MIAAHQPLAAGSAFTPPADGYVHVQPYGRYPFTLPDGSQILLAIDEAAVDAQIAAFKSSAASAGKAFAGILCDYDHQSCDPAQPTEAAAWATDLQKRPDGLWAKMRFTDQGLSAVTGGRYRFTSNVHLPSDCEQVAPGVLRPLRVDRFALTNVPRMLQGAARMQPLTSRADSPTNTNTKGTHMDCRIVLLKILGLPDTATDEELQAAAEKFGKEEAGEEAHQALTSRVADLEKDNAAMKSRAEQAETALAAVKADTTLASLEGEGYKFNSRDEVKARLVANHDDAVKFIRLQPIPVAKGNEPLRSDGREPAAAAADVGTLRAAAIKAEMTAGVRSRASATARAQAKHPELWK